MISFYSVRDLFQGVCKEYLYIYYYVSYCTYIDWSGQSNWSDMQRDQSWVLESCTYITPARTDRCGGKATRSHLESQASSMRGPPFKPNKFHYVTGADYERIIASIKKTTRISDERITLISSMRSKVFDTCTRYHLGGVYFPALLLKKHTTIISHLMLYYNA